MGKLSLWRIPRDHFLTLRNGRTGKIHVPDYLMQLGIPLAVSAFAWFLDFRLVTVDNAVAGISIVSGLLFAVVVFLFQLRTSLPNNPLIIDSDLELLDEIMFNCLWAMLWGLLLVFFLVVVGSTEWVGAPASLEPNEETLSRVISCVSIAAGGHLLMVLTMCLKRIHRAYERIAMGRN